MKVNGELNELDQPITGINITPLVDIILVLLIIFMVTATFLMSPSINVDLPKATTGEPTPISNIAVVIDAQGKLFLNGKPIDEEKLATFVRAKREEGSRLNAIIGADKMVYHGRVIHIVDLLKKEGVAKFAINVEGE
ncbi:MAG: biopolymer transporter ExbD [Proteobacteria bacterium]|jgi:biopolymer transport protein ExbD|nr:biopolymer transporter ExbD [Pseudomonadota bacterium]